MPEEQRTHATRDAMVVVVRDHHDDDDDLVLAIRLANPTMIRDRLTDRLSPCFGSARCHSPSGLPSLPHPRSGSSSSSLFLCLFHSPTHPNPNERTNNEPMPKENSRTPTDLSHAHQRIHTHTKPPLRTRHGFTGKNETKNTPWPGVRGHQGGAWCAGRDF